MVSIKTPAGLRWLVLIGIHLVNGRNFNICTERASLQRTAAIDVYHLTGNVVAFRKTEQKHGAGGLLVASSSSQFNVSMEIVQRGASEPHTMLSACDGDLRFALDLLRESGFDQPEGDGVHIDTEGIKFSRKGPRHPDQTCLSGGIGKLPDHAVRSGHG